MPDWVVDILKSYGLAGVVIFALVIVILYRERYIRSMGSDIKAMHEARGKEREILAVMLERATANAAAQAEATKDRNAVMEDLSDAVLKQAAALDAFKENLKVRGEITQNDIAAMKVGWETFTSSHRVIAAVVEDIRDGLKAITDSIKDVSAGVVDVKNDLKNIDRQLQPRPRR